MSPDIKIQFQTEIIRLPVMATAFMLSLLMTKLQGKYWEREMLLRIPNTVRHMRCISP